MIKFKFINNRYSNLEDLLEDCKNFSTEVENPIGVLNLPVGDYMIRGNKKGQRKEYFHFGNEVWYLISNVEEDNGHYMCDSYIYKLYPELSEKEWDKIRSSYKYLTPLWKRHLSGHDQWLDIRRMLRNIRKSFLHSKTKFKYKKKLN